ncbi:MAG: hypothetical protein LBI69_04270 [Puniceicoccales bacterium]|jgi:F0F1-type ATP synthase delta subunit|nr:hypothetical protein [Puniceicoccales bacterium]
MNNDETKKKMKEQLAQSEKVIAQAKGMIEKMREFFKPFGADLDSEENIFLNSPHISPEGRKQAMEAIEKMKGDHANQYKNYCEFIDSVCNGDGMDQVRNDIKENRKIFEQPSPQENKIQKRPVRKMRLF